MNQIGSDDRAVSPVIGVILMVAVTVILAAVIGAFVLGIGSQVTEETPAATIGWEFDTTTDNATITHDGGQDIDPGQLAVNVEGSTVAAGCLTLPAEFTAGESVAYDGGGSCPTLSSGDEVLLIYQTDSGTAILAQREVP